MAAPVFVVLSFEGPDGYSRAGGLASRVVGLTESLARIKGETHLFFIGDPDLDGHEVREDGGLHLHRWCQWISRYHRGGVYDGEEGKLNDWNRSLPGWLATEVIGPAVARGRKVVVLAEEWHTAQTVVAIQRLVAARGWQSDVALLWNANNTFGAQRIPWQALRQTARITTVSRYMKQALWGYGVDATVIPNGLQRSWLAPVDTASVLALRAVFPGRLVLSKVARFDPDKRWEMAVDAVALLKAYGASPVFLPRGGVEPHGAEVVQRALRLGLRVARVAWNDPGVPGLIQALRPAADFDMVRLDGYLSEDQRRVLYNGTHAVLANSGIEPFGLVGLETMASAGLAMVGATGEDYATNGYDSISIQTSDPMEIVRHAQALRRRPDVAMRIRRAARGSASRYAWDCVIDRILLPSVDELSLDVHGVVSKSPASNDHLRLDRPLTAGARIKSKARALTRASGGRHGQTTAVAVN
jgi:glycosyltransferase involved in cell wall biosynthesis